MKVEQQKITQDELQQQAMFIKNTQELLQKRYPEEIPLAYVHSFGCQQNVSDGEKIKGILAEIGYGFTDSADRAELVIFNTCAVRENAEDRVFGNLGALKKWKRQRPSMLIGLCGCMPQQEHVTEKVKKSFPYVELIFGTHALHKLPELLYRALSREQKRVVDIQASEGKIVEGLPVLREGSIKANLPIMYGCNNFCSYCIVPYVRGRERSRRFEDILQEARTLVGQGYKEIMLLGQNVNSYRGEDGRRFPDLLRSLNEIEGEFWIRFMTSHPKDATHELIDTMAECEKVCAHLHLPVQSGSNRILRDMNRNYTVESYCELIDYAKERISNLALTSDIIIGFPTERYEDAKETIELIRKVRYHNLYTFIYSKRMGTKAAEMEDPVPYKEKSKWFTELLNAQAEIGDEIYHSYLNKTLRVLVDSIGKSADGMLSGRSEQNIIVDFKGDQNLIGSFVDVKIIRATHTALIGEKI